MENEYKPKVGELVFTNAGAGRLERGETDKNFVPYYHIWATFLNDKGVKFAVQFAASFKNDKDCSCEWSENKSLLKIVNYFYGCSYTSVKIVEGMDREVTSKCK